MDSFFNAWVRSRAEAVERDLLVAYPVIDVRDIRCSNVTVFIAMCRYEADGILKLRSQLVIKPQQCST